MSRFQGRAPNADVVDETDMRPPRLPWVLLCHASGARCGTVFTVNRLRDWRNALMARRDHEETCTTRPVVVTEPAIE